MTLSRLFVLCCDCDRVSCCELLCCESSCQRRFEALLEWTLEETFEAARRAGWRSISDSDGSASDVCPQCVVQEVGRGMIHSSILTSSLVFGDLQVSSVRFVPSIEQSEQDPIPEGSSSSVEVPVVGVSRGSADSSDIRPMDHHERLRLRTAAFRATRLYPGPVGDVLSREILGFEDFGYRLGSNGPIMRLVDHLLKTPLAKAESR